MSVTINLVGPVRLGDTVPLSVLINKGNGTATTDPTVATWAVADPTIVTIAAGNITGMATGSTTVTAAYNGVSSSPVTVRVEPPRVHFRCEQGMALAAGTVAQCWLFAMTSSGGEILPGLPAAGWHISSSLASVMASDSNKQVVLPQDYDGTVTLTGTYNDGTPAGLTDSATYEIVNITALTITPPPGSGAVIDVTSLAYTDIPFTITRSSGGNPLPTGFWAPWKYNTQYSVAVNAGVKSATALSVEGMEIGTTTFSVSYGYYVTSNTITLRVKPDHVGFDPATSPVTVAVGANATATAWPMASSGSHTYVLPNAVVSVTSADATTADVTYSLTPVSTSGGGSDVTLSIHGYKAGQTTVTATINGVVSNPMLVTVTP